MSGLFSWSGLDWSLSRKAQLYCIIAGACANLVFLNRHIKQTLDHFLYDVKGSSRCELLIDRTETKLLYIYCSVFLLGVAALIVRYCVPEEISKFGNKKNYVKLHAGLSFKEISDHFQLRVFNINIKLRPKRSHIIELVESTRQLPASGMTDVDLRNFAIAYHSFFFDYVSASFIFAPIAKAAILTSAILFAFQALKTFFAVICLETSFGQLIYQWVLY